MTVFRPDLEDADIARRYLGCESTKVIARALGTSQKTIRRRLAIAGVETRPYGKIPQEWTLERLLGNTVTTEAGCREWQGATSHGYGVIQTGSTRDGTRGTKRTHQLAWELSRGNHPCLRGPLLPHIAVLHRCDNRPCIWPDDLFLGTIADNNADMRAKGRHKGGAQRAQLGGPTDGDPSTRRNRRESLPDGR